MIETLVLAQIVAPHFAAGVILIDDYVTDAAPIIKYMRSWNLAKIQAYCRRKGWECRLVLDPSSGVGVVQPSLLVRDEDL